MFRHFFAIIREFYTFHFATPVVLTPFANPYRSDVELRSTALSAVPYPMSSSSCHLILKFFQCMYRAFFIISITTNKCTINITTLHIKTVYFCMICTPTCFDISSSSSGSFTFVPRQVT